MLTEALRSLIDDAEVVSFDVFDTLLLRRHYLPADVFAHAGGASPRLFRFLRIAAEQIARLRHRRQQDVTLEQIYAVLGRSSAKELEAETRTLFGNPEAMEIYDYAVRQGKQVIAVSDMYLPQSFIRDRLAKAGFDRIERLFVSCEADRSKYSGDLYTHVADTLGIAPGRFLHIGDNEFSDVTRAREKGFHTWHLPSPRTRFETGGGVHPRVIRHLRRSHRPDHSLLLGILRDGPGPDADYWVRLGFSAAGPVLNAFVDAVQARFVREGHSALYLLARDGCLPQQIFAVRYPQTPTHYTFASRRLFLVAALEQLNGQALSALSAGLPGTEAREFWHRLGIPNRSVERLLDERFEPGARIETPGDRQKLIAFFRDAHPLMLPDIRRENAILREYLASIGLLGRGSPLVVDIGWRASSQRFLEKAIPELNATAGAYFGLSDDSYRNGRMRGWFFDGFRPLLNRRSATSSVEILELMFSAPHPSVRGIEVTPAGDFGPVYESAGPEELERIEIVRRIHEGAMAFTRLLHERSTSAPIEIGRRDAAAIIEAVVRRPMRDDILHLGRLPHALGLGISRYETLLPQVEWNGFGPFLAGWGLRSGRRRYWRRGLVRAIELEHGPAAGRLASVALTATWIIDVVRDRWHRYRGR